MAGHYESRTDRKKKLFKLAHAQSDIDAAGKACRLLLGSAADISHPLYYPLLCAVCVCYAKPFVGNKSLGPLPKMWRSFPEARMQEAHEQMIKARHEIIAHNDPVARAVGVIPPGWTPPKMKGKSVGLGIQMNNYYLTIPMLRDCIDTCQDLRQRLHKAVEEELIVLYGLSKGLPIEPFPLTFDEGL